VLGAIAIPVIPFGCARSPQTGGSGGTGASGSGGAGATAPFELLGAPLIVAPTAHGFGLNVVLRSGDPSAVRALVRDDAQPDGRDLGAPAVPTTDVAEFSVDNLEPGRRYAYEIRAAGSGTPLYSGSAVTTRPAGSRFSFAVLTDTHIPPRDPVPAGTRVGADIDADMERTLLAVMSDVSAGDFDFLVHMGDMLDFHAFGFNAPPPSARWTRLAYQNYRRLLGDTLGHAAHFPVIGNWDGENGCQTDEEIERSRSQRLLYVPGPKPDTYAQGGSAREDYYAFVWGDALFVMLNVMTYTPTCHLLNGNPGLPDDWTLGAAQLAWLEQTLAQNTSKWRFTFIHHTVGGAAGDLANSAYGRGGGQAAHVGEQAVIHDLLLRYGVQIFFYGHDHVFADMLVDGVHYTLPGSAGAPWKFTPAETGYTDSLPDSGYGRVTVDPDHVQVDFVALGGQVLTTFTLP
jgi:3',5'-cyclic AMP phosphodiesterase CpdA